MLFEIRTKIENRLHSMYRTSYIADQICCVLIKSWSIEISLLTDQKQQSAKKNRVLNQSSLQCRWLVWLLANDIYF